MSTSSASFAPCLRGLTATWVAGLLYLCAMAPAQEPPPSDARDAAQAYLENDEARKAAATLIEAARASPKDRVIGAMLYGALRDHVWHMPQTLPVVLDGPVHALVFSVDGTMVAAGADSGMVVIAPTEALDEAAAKAKRVELKMQGAVLGVQFAADGKRLAAVSAGEGVRVWDVATHAVVFEAKASAAVTAFQRNRAKRYVAIGAEDGSIQVLDPTAGRVVSQPEGARRRSSSSPFRAMARESARP